MIWLTDHSQDILQVTTRARIGQKTRRQWTARRITLAPKVTIGGKLKRVMYYIADFCYRDEQDRLIVEDVKGVRTAVYRVKIHLLKHIHGIDVVEI